MTGHADGPPPESPARPPLGCLAGVVTSLAALAALVAAVALLTGDPDPAADPTPDGSAAPAGSPIPTSTPLWTVHLAPEAGGWHLVSSGGPEETHRAGAMARAGIGVRSFVTGRYEDPSGAAVLTFYGGELEPLPSGRVGEARSLLGTAFEANFPNVTPVGEPRRYEAGPPGGELWCVSYDSGGHACGWVDEWTIGFVFAVVGREADTAAQLAGMRTDLEIRG